MRELAKASKEHRLLAGKYFLPFYLTVMSFLAAEEAWAKGWYCGYFQQTQGVGMYSMNAVQMHDNFDSNWKGKCQNFLQNDYMPAYYSKDWRSEWNSNREDPISSLSKVLGDKPTDFGGDCPTGAAGANPQSVARDVNGARCCINMMPGQSFAQYMCWFWD